jgi:orotate phosphoribosyltransferase
MSEVSPSEASPDVARLGRRLYERALVRREEEPITDPRGKPIGWLLDTRMALMESELYQQVGAVVGEQLRERGVRQIAGFGFGAYPVVGAVLGCCDGDRFSGGLIREHRKPYGRQRLVEGALDRSMPVAVVDDILNSGRSAEQAVDQLNQEGFTVNGVFTLFNFTWGRGKERLLARGLWVDSLLNLNLRDEDTDLSARSDSSGSTPS